MSAVSIVVNTLLFVAKYWVGIQSASVAILADAWHTISDSLSSFIVLFGYRAASRPPDPEHPYGHGRAEVIAAIVIGILLAIVAFNFVVEAIQRLTEHRAASYNTLALVVIGASVLTKEVLARISIRLGRRDESPALTADGWHHRSDAISSLLILLAMLFAGDLWWIDATLGILVALLIFYAAFEILRNGVSVLLGEEIDDALRSRIVELVSGGSDHELDPHNFRQHVYGQHRELTLHIRLPADLNLSEAHLVAKRLEGIIREETGIEPTIHVDPRDPARSPEKGR